MQNNLGDRRRPPQPGLRSFIVYDDVPPGCIVVEARDNSAAPHIEAGEFAVVDPDDRDPIHGEMFAIQWSSGGRDLIDARLRPGRYGIGPNGEMVDTSLWFATWEQTLTSLAGVVEKMRWADGPYLEEGFREMLMGRVVGIHQSVEAAAKAPDCK